MAGHIGDMVSQSWNTPGWIVGAIQQVFGGQIDLDPCDNDHSTTSPRISYKLPDTDGLAASWLVAPDGTHIRNVFCNPPYGRDKERKTSIADWIKRAAWNGENHEQEVALLIPASTELKAWHEYIWPSDASIAFLEGRVAFPLEGEEKASATKGTAIIYWGKHYNEFYKVFSEVGFVLDRNGRYKDI